MVMFPRLIKGTFVLFSELFTKLLDPSIWPSCPPWQLLLGATDECAVATRPSVFSRGRLTPTVRVHVDFRWCI